MYVHIYVNIHRVKPEIYAIATSAGLTQELNVIFRIVLYFAFQVTTRVCIYIYAIYTWAEMAVETSAKSCLTYFE